MKSFEVVSNEAKKKYEMKRRKYRTDLLFEETFIKRNWFLHSIYINEAKGKQRTRIVPSGLFIKRIRAFFTSLTLRCWSLTKRKSYWFEEVYIVKWNRWLLYKVYPEWGL